MTMPQEKSGGRIAPAEAEINRHEQRQIEDGGLCKMNRERCLDDQRQQRGDDDRPAQTCDFECDSPRISNASFIVLPPDADSLRRARAVAHPGIFLTFHLERTKRERTSTSSAAPRFAAGLM